MIDKYEEIYARYKEYIESNSQYNAKVVKHNISTSAYFPIVSCVLSNNIDTDYCTNYKEEYYEGLYLTIDIYTKDKKVTITEIEDGKEITKTFNKASQVVNDELTKLTFQFFKKLNMKKTLCKPNQNLDTSVFRRTIQYQGLIGNARGNIIRR